MALIIVNSDLLATTVGRYVWKFIVVPSGLNFLCIAMDTMVIRDKRLSQNQKIYFISLAFVMICFVLFAVHNAFTATYFLFAIAIILTTVYLNYHVTLVTAFTGIAALLVGELFVKWDLDKISIFDSTLRLSNYLVSLFILAACSFVCMIVIRYERQKNEASIQKEIERQLMAQRIQTDELTGVFSRKALHDAMRDMEANEAGDQYIFAIADIDHFKTVNDRFGHHAGDHCLIECANILKRNSGNATVFRYGGDEFCLLFRNAAMPEAVSTCEHIQHKMKDLCIVNDPTLKVTVSFGLAAYSDELNAARLFINADQALYEAKSVRDAIRVF
jgi:diguanylate cyclase